MGNRKESPLALLLQALPPAIVGAMVFQIAVLVGALVLGSVIVGLLLDIQLGTRPLLTLGLGVISLPVSIWLTYRIALRTIGKARADYEARARAKQAAALKTEPNEQSQASITALPIDGH